MLCEVLKVPTMPALEVSAFSMAISTARLITTIDIAWCPLSRPPVGVSISRVGWPSPLLASPPLVSLMMPWLLSRSCAHIMASRITVASASL